MPYHRAVQRAPNKLLAPAAVFYGLLAAAALAWIRHAKLSVLVARSPAAAAAGLALGLAVAVFSQLGFRRSTRIRRLALDFARILGPLGTWDALSLAVLSGVGEELCFRAALQGSLGLVPASLIFGLAHIGPRRGFWPWTVFAVAMGFALGLLYAWSGDLLGPILAHATVNALNLRALGRLARDSLDLDGGLGVGGLG